MTKIKVSPKQADKVIIDQMKQIIDINLSLAEGSIKIILAAQHILEYYLTPEQVAILPRRYRIKV